MVYVTTTELKILSLLEWENIFQNITQVDQTKPNELNANVWNANSLFNALRLKLNYTQELSVQDNATSKANNINFAPSLSPIIMSRKPLSENTVAENCLKHGVGGINIDGCRVPGEIQSVPQPKLRPDGIDSGHALGSGEGRNGEMSRSEGRFPANLIHDGSDEVLGLFPETKTNGVKTPFVGDPSSKINIGGGNVKPYETNSGSAARFFYCAKASKADRDEGLEGFEYQAQNNRKEGGRSLVETSGKMQKNFHPTVKPTKLMQYLVKLVTPKGGTVLDPFMGSGSTGKACKLEGFVFIGIEREEEYIKIAEARIKAVNTLL